MVSLALVAFLLHAAPGGAPPVPSDCEVEQSQDLSGKLHFPLFFVDARCAGESVAYLCTDTKCLKDPCGGAEGSAPQLLQVAKPAHSRSKGAKRPRAHGKKAKKAESSAASKSGAGGGASGEALALFLRGGQKQTQVVTISSRAGQPGCRPLRGLEQVLVDATNKGVKIGETLGRSGELDAIKGSSLVLTRGLYVGGDEPGAPSHGYLLIRAKISSTQLKFASASRKSADAVRFGRH